MKMSEWDELGEGEAKKPPLNPKKKTTKKKAKKPAAKDEQQAESKVSFSSKATEKWLFGDEDKADDAAIFCGIYGWDGTAKTGMALECRTPEQIANNEKIVVLDLDGGAKILRTVYHDSDPNIVIKYPVVDDEDHETDYEATFKRIKAAAKAIKATKKKHKVCAVILDGLDKLLKICEYSMREDLSIDATDGVSYRYWVNRNTKYLKVLEPLKQVGVDVYLITHLKPGETPADDDKPVWQKKTPDMLFQKIHCFKDIEVDEDGNSMTKLKATVKKCKTNLSLEEKTFTLAEVTHKKDESSEERWYGFQFRTEGEKESKRTVVYQRGEDGVWMKA